MKKIIQNKKVIQNIRLNENYFLLEMESPEKLPEIHPGQFAEFLVKGNDKVFLRRPISVNFVDYKKNTVSYLIKIVGKGTHQLSLSNKGEEINIVYPLGNGFDIESGKNPLLIGGGCGIAPLLYLAKVLNNKNKNPQILLGGKSKEDILFYNEFLKYGNVSVSTEDGSFGEKGLVTENSVMKKTEFDKVYTCGPEPMMKAIAGVCKKNNIECEVSLENMMACGIGACLCCVTETTSGHKCVCTEGPVFNIKDIKWQI